MKRVLIDTYARTMAAFIGIDGHEMTAPGNRWLMERWGVDLERHESPV